MLISQVLVIHGELPDLNTYINAERANKFGAAKIKKEATELVMWEVKSQKLKPIKGRIDLIFQWTVKDKKKDPDNIAYAKKFILDGLKEAGIIENDGWKQIGHFEDWFLIGTPQVKVTLRYAI